MNCLAELPTDDKAKSLGCYFDASYPDKVCKFVESFCRQSQGTWQGKLLELMEWQKNEVIYPLYGWRNADGTTRFKRAGIWIGKKQGKSTLMSALCLWHLVSEAGAMVACLASDIDQAGIVYREAAAMVEQDPRLAKRLWVRRNINAIQDRTHPNTVYKVLSSAKSGKGGWNASLLVFDELAEWGAYARDIWDQLHNATMARPNGLQIVISTAQYDREHIGYEQYRYAKQVLQGDIEDPSFLPVIHEVPIDKDWKDEKNWTLANPSLNVTVPIDIYRNEYKEAQSNPQAEYNFRTRLLNQWTGSAIQWVSSNKWEACGADYDASDFQGCSAVIGIDFARRYDLAAYQIIVEREGLLYLFPRFFLPADMAEKKEKEDGVRYTRWADANFVTLTPGDRISPKTLREHIYQDADIFDFLEIRYDAYGMEETAQILDEQGFYLVEVPQTGSSMAPATAHFERLILTQKIRHPRNPCLDWNVNNCTTREDNQKRIMIDKAKSRGRIDGATAAVIGLTYHIAQEGTTDLVMPVLM